MGEPVSMRCIGSGFPAPTLDWQGSTNPQASFVNGVFSIEAAMKSDENQYTCTAINELGEAKAITVIYVSGGTVVMHAIITHVWF